MPLPTPEATVDSALSVLKEVFGYAEFRPGQEEVIGAVLAGRDTLGVMPTGGGKSVCYQVPALLQSSGVTVVVSPLLALMKDQVDALRAAGVAAAAVNSTVERDEQVRILRAAATGEVSLLYVAPERFANHSFMRFVRENVRVALLAVDEAHCVSQWGHDFRPVYRDLADVREQLGWPPMVALTATADPRVRDDIVRHLRLRDPEIFVSGFDRPNLHFEVVRARSKAHKAELIGERLLAARGEAAIVYCGTRKNVDALVPALRDRGIRCAAYHAGMDDATRKRAQEAFQRDRVPVIVATNAFGMGIDKPDVRMVLHHDMPESIESYYQEAGRAGRDGDPATAALFYNPRDRGLREFFIDMAHPEPATVMRVYETLLASGRVMYVRELVVADDEQQVNAALQALVQSGLAERRGAQARLARVGTEADIDLGLLEEHRRVAESRLDAMQAYAESTSCLRARIVRYFGETAPRSCGNCGPCCAVATGPGEAPAEEEAMFQQLRELRREIADEAQVPAYVIFSDATLRDMAKRRPRTQQQMLEVSGVGRVKWERFGERFLRITRG